MKLSRNQIIILIIAAIVLGIVIQAWLSLPKVETLDYYIPSETTVLFSDDGKPFAKFHQEENRKVVTMPQISPYMQRAVVAIEDERFYEHKGIDFTGIGRAMFKNLMYGRIVEGGSTITQQLARNLFLTRRKTIARKLSEAILAINLERRFTKAEILEYYLNQIYFGHNAYGIESASDLYFSKHARDLDLAEAALLAGIIEGPEIYSPFKDLNLAKSRQRIVLAKMVDLKLISLDAAQYAFQEQLELHPENLKRFGGLAPYFVSYIMQQLIDKFGEEAVNKGGLRVYTTLNQRMQMAAEEVITRFVSQEGSKYNFSQSALVAIDPRNGGIKAMVGGFDFIKSQFNRAVQAKRQPGSAFKPFVYAAAVEQGISPGTVLSDKPLTYNVIRNRWNPDGKWVPKNFDSKFRGNVTMQYALEKSLNIPSIRLLEKVGVTSAINMAHRMGIKSHLEPALALTLGASEVTLLEITSAFGVFADNGMRFEPVAITKILDRNGNKIFEAETKGEKILDENTAAIMDEMMEGVILRGTGVRGNIGRPAAAKTGTSQEFRDAWFIGFVPQLTAGVWAGNDDNRPMKGVAEVSVCPRIWKDFMQTAVANEPVMDFPHSNLITVRICLSSGLLPNSSCPKNRIVSARFFEKDAPVSECFVHPTEEPMTEDEEIKEELKEEENEGNFY